MGRSLPRHSPRRGAQEKLLRMTREVFTRAALEYRRAYKKGIPFSAFLQYTAQVNENAPESTGSQPLPAPPRTPPDEARIPTERRECFREVAALLGMT